jgi:hypothetical protein
MSKIFINYEKIKDNKLYKLIYSMPKGGMLHTHYAATINLVKFIMKLKLNHKDIYNKIYYLNDYNKVNDYINLLSLENNL